MQQYGRDYQPVEDFELNGIHRKTHRIEDAIIPEDPGTTSNAVDLRGYGLIGLILPTLTNCNLTFEVSETEGGTYRALNDNLGAAVTITAATGNRAIAADDLNPLSAYRWVKLVSNPVQAAARTCHFIVKA